MEDKTIDRIINDGIRNIMERHFNQILNELDEFIDVEEYALEINIQDKSDPESSISLGERY